jgi:hypothetical protein
MVKCGKILGVRCKKQRQNLKERREYGVYITQQEHRGLCEILHED